MIPSHLSNSRVSDILDNLTQQLREGWAVRIVLAVLALGSITMIWWSLNERLSLVYGSKSLIQQQEDIRREIDLLKVKINGQQPTLVEARLANAEAKMMQGQSTLAKWLNSQIAEAQKRNIKLTYSIRNPEKASEKLADYEMLPIEFTIAPTANLDPLYSYQDILTFADDIVSGQWRTTLVETRTAGDGKNVQAMSMKIFLWMRKDTKSAITSKSGAT